MSKISVLPGNLINQIAAGEVIENPSSIVKELIENSIDSGASEIKLFIEDGGHSLIKIYDNGSGMNKVDLKLAFCRHATSKIRTKDDLVKIQTLGFRGEALPSIASVSRVLIETSFEDIAYRMKLEAGKIIEVKKTARNQGTKIEVKNLFYNIPARKKFLKSSSQELRNISKILKRYLLSYPNISFYYESNGKIIYDFKETNLEDRIVQLFSSSYKKNILPIDGNKGEMSIDGYIGSLNLTKKRRGDQYLFLNGRYIKDNAISSSIRNSYYSLVDRGEHPFYVLFLKLPTDIYDINVHPTKIEARFNNKWDIINFITSNIKVQLKKLFNVIPDITFNTSLENQNMSLEFNKSATLEDVASDRISSSQSFKDNILPLDGSVQDGYNIEKAFNRLDDFDKDKSNTSFLDVDKDIWQIHNKYLITEIHSGLLVIDQHVAHERVLYEKAKEAFDKKPLSSQSVLFPKTIKFEEEEYHKFIEIFPYLEKIGFRMREFGHNTIIVDGIPADIKWGKEEDIINDVLDRFMEHKKISSSFIDYIAATYSCKAATKAGDSLEPEERRHLIDSLFATKNPYHCPHGRPIIITIKTDEFDKRFERK